MSFTRRLAAALPAVGVTVFAALAFAGQPASAAPVVSPAGAEAAAVAVTTEPTCDAGSREKCDGYGYVAPTTGTPSTTPSVDNTRGNGGYGGTSPATTRPTPSASANEVPGGELPTTVSPAGESPGDTLPLTGAPVGTVTTIGALLAVGGAAILFAMRRRRSA